jgi:O-antigen ligase
LASLCILLTGSRSSLLGLLVWFLIVIWGTRYRLPALTAFALAAPLAFVALPDELQTRFETIVNPEVRTKSDTESGQGRLYGFLMGMELWASNPLMGVGPGAWRPATGQPIESHNLYGQLLGETGSLGGLAFLFLLACFWKNLRAVRRSRAAFPEQRNDLVYTLPASIGVAVFLLLFMGNFGHNLFRFTWLWYGGFLIVARHCVARRVGAWEAEPEFEEATVPDGWVMHPPHIAFSTVNHLGR